jgi:dipeptidyl aminopeptidase/acylaminoacyl peptidase
MTTTTRVSPIERWRLFRDFRSLYSQGRIDPVWAPDGTSLCYLDGPQAHCINPATGEARPLWNTDRLREVLAIHFKRPVAEIELAGSSFSFVGDKGEIRLKLAGRDVLVDLNTYGVSDVSQLRLEGEARGTPRTLRPGAMAGLPPVKEAASIDGTWLATEIGNDLAVRWAGDDRIRRLTDDGTADQRWDVGTVRWAPDGMRLLAGRVDSRGVDRMLEMHWLQQVEQVDEVLYPRMGGRLPTTEWYVIDRLSRERVTVAPAAFLRGTVLPVGWRPDGSEVLFLTLDNEYTRVRLVAADSRSGDVRVVLEEETDGTAIAYFRTTLQLTCLATPLAGGAEFLWSSHRDGWTQLYRYSFDGRLLNRVTMGTFDVASLLGVDEAGGYAYLTAIGLEPDRPYDIHAIRAPLAGGNFERLTHAPGAHRITLSPSRQTFVDTHSTVNRPTQTDFRGADGRLIGTVAEAGTERLRELDWREPQEFVVKAADGLTDLHGVLYLPSEFDPSDSYPVIDAIYGGPQMAVHPVTFDQEAFDVLPDGRGAPFGAGAQAMAQLGFVVFVVDARGTPGRGHEFAKLNIGCMGQNEIPDHVAALRQLAESRPYMDLDRVGIYGGSYGGYMTLRAMLLAPDVYKVGISTAPMVDHHDIGAFHAGIVGAPSRNAANHDLGSNLLQADRLQGKLLLIHGTSDRNAPVSGTMKMADALIKAGKQFDLLLVPEMNHHAAGVHQTYLGGLSARYMVEHLKPSGVTVEDIPLTDASSGDSA